MRHPTPGDFDPDQFDAAMRRAFGEEYYAQPEAEALDAEGAEGAEDEGNAGGDAGVGGGAKRGAALLAKGAEAKRLLEEVAKCDYDDIVDDTPMRFRLDGVARLALTRGL